MKTIKSSHQEWILWFTKVKDTPTAIYIDINAFQNDGNNLQLLALVKLENLGTERNGFPTEKVYNDIIYPFEEKLFKLNNKSMSLYIGRTALDGKVIFYIYAKKESKIGVQLAKIIEGYQANNPKIRIKPDAEWKFYQAIFPPIKVRQRWENEKLVYQLVQQGANPEKQHLIDHVIYFSTKKDMYDYLKNLKKLNYTFDKYTVSDADIEENLPFTLEISIRSSLDTGFINSVTDVLLAFAAKYNAKYDGWGTFIQSNN